MAENIMHTLILLSVADRGPRWQLTLLRRQLEDARANALDHEASDTSGIRFVIDHAEVPPVQWPLPAPPPRHEDGAYADWLAAVDGLVAGTNHRSCTGWSHDSRDQIIECSCGARLRAVLLPVACGAGLVGDARCLFITRSL